jgi:hypothetical protein
MKDPKKAAADAAPTQDVQHALVALDGLTPHPRNYRRHPESQVARLEASLARFGQVRSIVVQQGADGRYLIVAGHGLVTAAQAQGLRALRADVIPASWTPQQVEGYLIADNESSRTADDDLVALAALLEEQQHAGFALETLGYSDEELAALLDDLAGAMDRRAMVTLRELDENTSDIGDAGDTPRRVTSGDIWQLGAHRLWCGDATDSDGVLRLLAGAQPSAAFCDPPFEMKARTQAEAVLSAFRTNAPNVVLWTGMIPAVEAPAHVRGNGYRLSHLLVWDRGETHRAARAREHHNPLISLTILPVWRRDGVPAVFDGARGVPLLEALGVECPDGFPQLLRVSRRADSDHSGRGEYTKPVALVAALYSAYGLDGPILDLFSGAGAGFLAGERLNQAIYGVELDPRRCDVILMRWEAETGREATRLASPSSEEASDASAE